MNHERIRQIADEALSLLPELLFDILPGGRLIGSEYTCGNLKGGPGESCKVNVTTGLWSDFATGEAGGDLVSLLATIRRCSQSDAAAEIAERMGPTSSSNALRKTARDEIWEPILPIPHEAPPAPALHHRLGRPTITWEYRVDGELVQIINRFDTEKGKEILPLTYCKDGKGRKAWRWQSLPKPRPLYGLDLIGDTERVVVVEGEKAADAALRILKTIPVITWPGGSNAVHMTDWTPLRGKIVVYWPDTDLPGHKAAIAVAEATTAAGAVSVKIVEPPAGVPQGWDLADAETEGWTREQVLEKCRAGLSPGDFQEKYAPASEPPETLPFAYRRLSDIQATPIRWLWPGRIARGKVSMVAGNPGLGKSQLTASLAAIITTGGVWPVDCNRCELGNVIFLSAEDDAADTIRPRLEAAGADLKRVYILDAVQDGAGKQRAFSLKTDIPRLEKMLELIGDVALIVVDPITAYLGGADSHKNAEIRALLSPLGELAARHGAAVVCVSHLNKGGSSEAMMRVTGSLAFVAAARAAFLVARDKENHHRRLFLPIKNNIGNDERGLAFTVESYRLPCGIEASHIMWEEKSVTVTADEAMIPQGYPEERSALDDAKEFLSNLLAGGPVSSRQIKGDADGAGHSWPTVRRAQKALGIEAFKDGMKGPWLWQLPTKMLKSPENAHANEVSTFGAAEHLRQDSEAVAPGTGGNPALPFIDLDEEDVA